MWRDRNSQIETIMTTLNWNRKTSSKAQTGNWKEYLAVPKKFSHGIYAGKDIGSVYKSNSQYIEYILTNQPHGTLAFQIVEYFNPYGF
jgi:hypothetical protein